MNKLTEDYTEFLEGKIKLRERNGIKVDAAELHHSTKPHQRDIILWSLELGAALIAADTGMGKTHISIEISRLVQLRFGGKYLIVTELGAAETYAKCGNQYLKEEELKRAVPTLFDLLTEENKAA